MTWDTFKEATGYGHDDMAYLTRRIERLRGLDAYRSLVTVHDYGFCNVHSQTVDERYARAYRERGVPPEMAKFYGMIENFDEIVGRLRVRLDALGLAKDTLLIFMSDNGTAAGVVCGAKAVSGTDAWQGFNAGMRATKGSEYDGGHRVALFMHWPEGGLAKGRDIAPLTAHLDLLPTLVELCRLPAPAGRELDGKSLAPLLRSLKTGWPARTPFVHVQREHVPPKWKRSAVLTDRWRLVNRDELYDMKADPGQATNVAAKHPKVVASLRAAYETWWTSLTPAFTRDVRMVIGAPQDNPTVLNCMDWQSPEGSIPWDQPQIAADPHVNGTWMIEVASAGRYQFTLSRRPAEEPVPLQATNARARIGAVEATVPVATGATAATIVLELPAGPAAIQTWLTEDKDRVRGAFYVEARRLD